MFGFTAALTLLVVDTALFFARAAGLVSIRDIALLDAAVVLAYSLAAGIFHWKGRSIPRID
jgi:hypothetical protein